MIGIVVVSHSPALARAAVELALEMGGDDPPRIAIAAGTAGGTTGTDAVAIAAAIDELASPEGVLVVMDLGSALLSAELALELRSSMHPVTLSSAPFVEGLVSAVVAASAGSTLADVDAESDRAIAAKRAQLGHDAASPSATVAAPEAAAAGFDAVLRNPSGLHARPAASFVKAVGRYDAVVEVTDLDSGRGPASGASLVSLMSLGAGAGAHVRVTASGPDAAEALVALRELIDEGFGEI
ncbi:MAG: HPr family phosphocarrier protein [Microbacterium sp.]